jgi:5-methylcytosine-specific restriction endonuclease McrA
MIVTPHFLSVLAYFDDLRAPHYDELRAALFEIVENPPSFFSINDASYVSIEFQVVTKNATLSPEADNAAEIDNLMEVLKNGEWRQASFTIYHATRSPNLGLKHVGAFKNERLNALLDNIDGVCQLAALFRENFDTEAYLMRVAGALALTEKPKKPSRHIPEQLETKLLCDSIHLCNICREKGVIIHHIVPIEEGGRSEEENLIVLCLNHHNDAHSNSNLSKRLRPGHLREYKTRHMAWVAIKGLGIGSTEIVQ